jgi:hypothetical protein
MVDTRGYTMSSDNLALKLLVAGIIGAVIGAAAAERYHFPTGLVYGGWNRPTVYRARPPIDANSGRADRPDSPDDDGVFDDRRPVPAAPPPTEWEPPPRRYLYSDRYSDRYPDRQRPPPRVVRPPASRAAWCWRQVEDWNFGTTRRLYRCSPNSAGRVYRAPRENG